ncbi:MAG: peptide/nickel transport system permease protein, partial [Saprospiraceae bacterium]
MFFGNKKEIKIAEELRDRSPDQSYRAMVQRQFRKNRLAVWSLRILYALIFIAIFGDFIANEKPLYCKIDGKTYYPVCRQYLVDFGLAKWEAKFINSDWSDQEYESVIYPPIPYAAKTLDLKNTTKGPFSNQNVISKRFHHWLGTDHIGRDIAAGMIRGTRIALQVGIIAMGVATLIGLLLGGLAGFFGDDQLYVSRARLVLNILGVVLGIFYGFGVRSYTIMENGFLPGIFIGLLIFVAVMISANLLAKGINRIFPPKRKIALPIDIIVMRLIEIMNSIPNLIFLLAILAIIEKSSIINVMIIIGLIGWTGIARFVRSELLRIRALDYIEAARSMGFTNFRILMRHAIPNALTPVLISIAFGVAGAILTEASLSFLGIGMPTDEVTWGKILNLSRANISSWWLAIF